MNREQLEELLREFESDAEAAERRAAASRAQADLDEAEAADLRNTAAGLARRLQRMDGADRSQLPIENIVIPLGSGEARFEPVSAEMGRALRLIARGGREW